MQVRCLLTVTEQRHSDTASSGYVMCCIILYVMYFPSLLVPFWTWGANQNQKPAQFFSKPHFKPWRSIKCKYGTPFRWLPTCWLHMRRAVNQTNCGQTCCITVKYFTFETHITHLKQPGANKRLSRALYLRYCLATSEAVNLGDCGQTQIFARRSGCRGGLQITFNH